METECVTRPASSSVHGCVAGGVAAPVEADQWRDAYELDQQLVPSFISDDLARKIVRAGKSINFLRQECGDGVWVQQATQMDSFALEVCALLLQSSRQCSDVL